MVGVTLVFAHTDKLSLSSPNAGKLTIDQAASVSLSAASNAAGLPAALNGFLFYRDPDGFPADSQTSPAVSIASNPDVNSCQFYGAPDLCALNGAMYFPGAHAYFAANTSPWGLMDNLNCALVIAGTLYLGYQPGSPPSSYPQNPYYTELTTDAVSQSGNYGCSSFNFSSMPTAQVARVVQ
jgi:hypothetical protein